MDDISHLSDQEQAEIIAEKFTALPNEYQELKADDIEIPAFTSEDIPEVEPAKVWQLLAKLKTQSHSTWGFSCKTEQNICSLSCGATV